MLTKYKDVNDDVKRTMKFIRLDIKRFFREAFNILEDDEFSAVIEYDYETLKMKVSGPIKERAKSITPTAIELYLHRCRPGHDYTKVKILADVDHFTVKTELDWFNKDNEKVIYNVKRVHISPEFNNITFSKGDIIKMVSIEKCLKELITLSKKDAKAKTDFDVFTALFLIVDKRPIYVYRCGDKKKRGQLNEELSEKLNELVKCAGINLNKNIKIEISNLYTDKCVPVIISEHGYDSDGEFVYCKKEMFFILMND